MNITIEVPTSAAEIPLHRYQAFAALTDEERMNFTTVFMVLTGCSEEVADGIKAKDVERALNALIAALKDNTADLLHHYTHGRTTYGFEPQLDEITFGMMTDICTAFESPDTWHKALAILYRPILRTTEHMGGLYAIEPHRADSEAYKQRQANFKHAPTSVFLGVRSFFLNGSRDLGKFIRDSSALHSEKPTTSSGKRPQ